MNMKAASLLAIGAILAGAPAVSASGHGPVFGGATPTLGRGGWSVDQAWTLRGGDRLRRIQTGQPQDYVYGVTFGALLLFVWVQWWWR